MGSGGTVCVRAESVQREVEAKAHAPFMKKRGKNRTLMPEASPNDTSVNAMTTG